MKKIMFDDNFHLTEAVLNGEKTVTRRAAHMVGVENEFHELVWNGEFKPPKYKVGEVVAVAQNYKDAGYDPDMLQLTFVKKAQIFPDLDPGLPLDGWIDLPFKYHKGWTNKMFVNADLMPHQIEITDVRLERVTEITDQDCFKEGVSKSYVGYYVRGLRTKDWKKEPHVEMDGTTYRLFSHPKRAFRTLIEKECGNDFWTCNRHVYVYTFKLVK